MDYSSGGGTGAIIILIVEIVIGIAMYIAFALPLMKIGNKKGLNGVFAWIPILSTILMIQIAEKPIWWIAIILLVPIANIIFGIMLVIAFLQAIDKPAGWVAALFLCPPLFLVPIWQAAKE